MPSFICRQCGMQYAESAAPPAACPVCEDERQYVRWDGQAWTTLGDLRASHGLVWEPEGPGLVGVRIEPAFAIGQRALLVETGHGNVLWDCLSLVDDAAVARIRGLGGLAAIAISHPHYYTACVEWSEALGGVPVWLHGDDRQWVGRPHRSIAHWSGDTHALLPGVRLVRCGGHFPGACVLHWAGGENGRGAILSGDTLQVVMDRRHVSFMWSYPNIVPLNAAAVRRIEATLAPLAFDAIYGAFARRNILGGAKASFERSVERYLQAIS
jgi:hypothetical protein